MVKMRTEGRVENRAVYVAIGINLEGQKEVLGLWTSANEGAKFWLQVLTELQNRGSEGHLHRLRGRAEGLPAGHRDGISEDHGAVVHRALVRASLNYVNWKERKQCGARAEDDLPGGHAARRPSGNWRRLPLNGTQSYPSISALWRRNWQGVIPFFQFPPEIRKIVYTTNAIESLNMSLRKAIKTRGAFPSEDAALKVMYLALRNLAGKWQSVQGWKEALNRFALLWDARFPQQGL